MKTSESTLYGLHFVLCIVPWNRPYASLSARSYVCYGMSQQPRRILSSRQRSTLSKPQMSPTLASNRLLTLLLGSRLLAPRVSSVALVPDQDAGVLSHLASQLFSYFRFQRHGLVAGSDVLSVLARAEYYMNEKDLDSATRELNQLNSTAKILLSDWLEAARRRLEVLQALEVVQSQATLASLLVV